MKKILLFLPLCAAVKCLYTQFILIDKPYLNAIAEKEPQKPAITVQIIDIIV